MPLNTSEDERLDALEARLGRFEECVQLFVAEFRQLFMTKFRQTLRAVMMKHRETEF